MHVLVPCFSLLSKSSWFQLALEWALRGARPGSTRKQCMALRVPSWMQLPQTWCYGSNVFIPSQWELLWGVSWMPFEMATCGSLKGSFEIQIEKTRNRSAESLEAFWASCLSFSSPQLFWIMLAHWVQTRARREEATRTLMIVLFQQRYKQWVCLFFSTPPTALIWSFGFLALSRFWLQLCTEWTQSGFGLDGHTVSWFQSLNSHSPNVSSWIDGQVRASVRLWSSPELARNACWRQAKHLPETRGYRSATLFKCLGFHDKVVGSKFWPLRVGRKHTCSAPDFPGSAVMVLTCPRTTPTAPANTSHTVIMVRALRQKGALGWLALFISVVKTNSWTWSIDYEYIELHFPETKMV